MPAASIPDRGKARSRADGRATQRSSPPPGGGFGLPVAPRELAGKHFHPNRLPITERPISAFSPFKRTYCKAPPLKIYNPFRAIFQAK